MGIILSLWMMSLSQLGTILNSLTFPTIGDFNLHSSLQRPIEVFSFSIFPQINYAPSISDVLHNF
jgi:hypothetical protein